MTAQQSGPDAHSTKVRAEFRTVNDRVGALRTEDTRASELPHHSDVFVNSAALQDVGPVDLETIRA